VTGSPWSFGLDGPTGTNDLRDPASTWADLDWLAAHTRLPLVVKGIMVGEDGRQAAEHGAKGVIVSNHGARYLDTTLATIEALPEVVEAMAGQAEVYLDGGIRRGTDVFKALALGARAVLIGRPVFWGLAVAGETGCGWCWRCCATSWTPRWACAAAPPWPASTGSAWWGSPLMGGIAPGRPVPLKGRDPPPREHTDLGATQPSGYHTPIPCPSSSRRSVPMKITVQLGLAGGTLR